MTNTVGCSTIYRTILPNNEALSYIKPIKLSHDARHRLAVIEHYLLKTHNVTLTCRHFAITRSYFYKWYKRYNSANLSSLESRSRKPHNVRLATYDAEVINLVRSYRTNKDTCTLSAYNLAYIFKRDYPATKFCLSASTIGRIIKRFNLFFSALIRITKNHVKGATRAWNRLKKRRPAGLKATSPKQIIEFDMKHIYANGSKYYAFCAIDPYTKESVIQVARTCSSHQAKLAIEKVLSIFGGNITILNDNGSENKGEVWQYLEDEQVLQYFASPHAPKEKPFVERLIGSLQRECLDQRRNEITSLNDLDYYVTRWLNNYHFFRPHYSLNQLTPAEYCATLGLTISRREVSTM